MAFNEFGVNGSEETWRPATLANDVGVTGGGSFGGPATPVNPWTPDYSGGMGGLNNDYTIGGMREDPTAGAGVMFNTMFGHNSVTNPFTNTFSNLFAPGLDAVFALTNPGADPTAFVDYMQNYVGALTDDIRGNVLKPSDIPGLMNQIMTNAGDAVGGMTDSQIMSMMGAIMDVAGYGMGKYGKANLGGKMKQLASDWGSAALTYGPEQAGNAFINFLQGRGGI